MEQTRKKQDKSLSDFKERTVTASMALEGSIQHTSQERTPERVTEQDVVIPIRQYGGSQERVQQHTVALMVGTPAPRITPQELCSCVLPTPCQPSQRKYGYN